MFSKSVFSARLSLRIYFPKFDFFSVQTVAAHERSMREQAKKMNVASLRSAEAANQSAEAKLAKVKNCNF